MNKNPEITDATRKKLILAFCELYKEKPINKITIKEITNIAGYNRSTFYQYFYDVYALLEYVENEIIAIGMESISSIDPMSSDFNKQFVITLSNILDDHKYYSTILLKNGAGSDFFRKIKKSILPFAVERFHIKPDNAKALLAVEFYLTGMLDVITHRIKNPDDISLDKLGSLVQGIWCDGLLKQL